MLALFFTLLLIATLYAWRGHRKASIYIFSINFVLSTLWFLHHMTSKLTIQL